MNPKKNVRERLIGWQRHRLFLPRLQMILILSLTGFAGFLTSFVLLRAGMEQMWMRYPLAILAAYVAFLLTLRLWIAFYLSQETWNLGGNPSSPTQNAACASPDFNLPVGAAFGAADQPETSFSFGGGDFGGAGAGGSWGDAIPDSSSLSSGGSSDSDPLELGLIILAVVAIIGGLLASLYIVYIAPVLLAEILVDGFLVRGLYERVENIERKHWLQTAIWKTLLPALLCVIFFGVAGMALQIAAPDAKSIGEVWRELKTNKPAN